jgi:hypothetical protein
MYNSNCKCTDKPAHNGLGLVVCCSLEGKALIGVRDEDEKKIKKQNNHKRKT